MPRTAILCATILLAALTLACDEGGSTPGATPTSTTPSRSFVPYLIPNETVTPGKIAALVDELLRPDYRWSSAADMPTPRAEVAAAVLNNNIYIAGGFTENGQNTNIVEVYDTTTDTWSTIAPMPERLDHAMAAAANGKLYIIGGWRVFGEQASDAVYEYDPQTERWRSVAKMPFPRAAGAATSADSLGLFGPDTTPTGTIYVVGGVGPEPEVALAYNASTDEWRRIASIAAPREHLAAVVVADKLYAIGGRWSDRGNVATVEEYDPATNTWRERAPMPTARGGLAAAATNDRRIHVVGGESFGEGSRTFQEHEVYTPSEDRWRTEDDLPLARHGLAAAIVGDRLYVIAGGQTPGLSVSPYVEIYEPLPDLPRVYPLDIPPPGPTPES